MDSQQDDLDELVVAAQAGQTAAFGELWRRLSPRVAGYLRARGVADADDVTSEVFLAVFTRFPRFHGDGAALRSFVFTVAHHRAVDAVRRNRRHQPEVPYEEEAHDDRTVGSAEDEALQTLAADRARALLALLPPAQQEVLALRILGELTVTEVSELTGRSTGAVKQLQRRGLTALQRHVSITEARVPVPRSAPRSMAQTS